MTATESGEPRWATVPDAAAYSGIPGTTIRRWISHGYVTAYRRGPRLLLVDLDDLDAQVGKRAGPPRSLSEDDERLARQVAAALLPLAPRQREKLAALLLDTGRDRHDDVA